MTKENRQKYTWCPVCKHLTGYYGVEFSSQRVVCFSCTLVLNEEPAKVISSKEENMFLRAVAEESMQEEDEDQL